MKYRLFILISGITALAAVSCGVEPAIVVFAPTEVPTVLPSPIVPTIERVESLIPEPTEVAVLGRWDETSSLLRPRSSHVAVRLNDGTVLVAGGSDPNGLNRARGGRILGITGFQGGQAIATTEVYDPPTSSWASAGSLNVPRLNATATLLQDGRVLIVGGENNGGTPLNSAEIYDPAKFTWANLPDMASPRTLHTATLLPDGRVIVIGGSHGEDAESRTTVEIFDPESLTWSAGPQLPEGVLQQSPVRLRHAVILLDDTHLLMSGGLGPTTDRSEFTALQTAYILDLESMEWEETGAMGDRRQGHTHVMLDDGRILAVGGASQNPASEVYRPEEGEWFTVGANSRVREDQNVVRLDDGRVLMAGGRNGFRQTDQAEIFDPETDEWTRAPDMNDRRLGSTAIILENGTVLVAGGTGSDQERRYGNTASAEIYNPDG